MNKVSQIVLIALIVLFGACSKRELNTKVSHATGWNYYDKKTTYFEAIEGVSYGTPSSMVAIEGGSFTIGEKDEFVTAPRDNMSRSVTVSSFYMDKYEITNLDWNEYIRWMSVVFGKTNIELVKKALPDTTVWREEMAYNEPYLQYYFHHPAYSFYPVVGVSWNQAMAYCQWRTDRVNELALWSCGEIARPPFNELAPLIYMEDRTPAEGEVAVGEGGEEEVEEEGEEYEDEEEDEEGGAAQETDNRPAEVQEWERTHPGFKMVSKEFPNPKDSTKVRVEYYPPYEWVRQHFVFNTEKYLHSDEYAPEYGNRPIIDKYTNQPRKVKPDDGILVIGFRLPTEAEWEFAAYAPYAEDDGLSIEGKIYPWSGYHPRDLSKENIGRLQANFVRGRGDMMGMSGKLNDNYVITGPVDAFLPNDFGLYNMAGNVNEWVLDVYRETSYQETSEYNSFRGNIFSQPKRDENGRVKMDSIGCIEITYSFEDDKRDWKDGDSTAFIPTDYPLERDSITKEVYLHMGYDTVFKNDPSDILAPRITKTARVYKGGSWKDRIYWLNPSTRRYLDQDKSSNTVGFRCAMSILGEQQITPQ
ncbi:MAG: SUMF1/EgtB/PvdO family nonheme iron enzyme [Paludibacteraceae bacterium]|nr:SUMF1/EgtB/PvdO family nonheme iron enzyme [Paludibacteraceae bacterium]